MHVPGVKYGKILFSPFSLFHVSVRSRMRPHNFATVSAKNKVKISSYSTYFELQNGIKNAITQKCGEWVVHACTVTNIAAKPTYGVYISQLIRICRICDNYSSFLSRHKLLTERLVRQGFWYNKLCITFKKFARRYNVLISKYGVSVRAHVTEGICIPLVAKPDLIRNVTISGCGRVRSTHYC